MKQCKHKSALYIRYPYVLPPLSLIVKMMLVAWVWVGREGRCRRRRRSNVCYIEP